MLRASSQLSGARTFLGTRMVPAATPLGLHTASPSPQGSPAADPAPGPWGSPRTQSWSRVCPRASLQKESSTCHF